MARFFLTLVVICGIAGVAWYAYQQGALAGLVPTLSSPAPVSNSFSYQNTSADTVFVFSPKPGGGSTEHITVTGFARGPWYSPDGTFPVTVTTANGIRLGSGEARAGRVWAVSTAVPFTADFVLTTIYTGGAIVTLTPGAASSIQDASLSFPIVLR